MVIILNKATGLRTRTWGEYFSKPDVVLTMSMIKNWDDVVDNIKNAEMRRDATLNGCLFGVEYPADTPITGGGGK